MGASYDWQLHRKLTRMQEERGSLHLFYCCAPWQRLRAHVLGELHHECQDCLAKSPARYVPAECVHHVHEVEHEPGWALTEFVPDEAGNPTRNLVPLCHECHDARHGRFRGRARRRDDASELTPERW